MRTLNYLHLIRKNWEGAFLIFEAKATPLLQAVYKHYNMEAESINSESDCLCSNPSSDP